MHLNTLEPIDYLIVGHLTVDLTATGPSLGGSAAYAALTARALGLRVGVVTAWGNEIPLTALGEIPVIAAKAEHSTTFENIYTEAGRIQYIRQTAPRIDFSLVPAAWRSAKILHLAPIAQEVDAAPPDDFYPTLLGLTLQGWLRAYEADGRVHPCAWSQSEAALSRANAAVLSVEDLGHDEEQIEWMAHSTRLLAVTEGAAGARLFWNGDGRRFRSPQVQEVDATGAGDIFAAAFFVRLMETRDPWEAARFANQVAAISVTRSGLQGVPTAKEIQACLMEVLP